MSTSHPGPVLLQHMTDKNSSPPAKKSSSAKAAKPKAKAKAPAKKSKAPSKTKKKSVAPEPDVLIGDVEQKKTVNSRLADDKHSSGERPSEGKHAVRTFNKKMREAYLDALAEHGTVTYAIRACGTTLQTINAERDRNLDFIMMEEAAYEEHKDSIYNEVVRRGRDGVPEPVFGPVTKEIFYDEDGNQVHPDTINPAFLPPGVKRVRLKEHGIIGFKHQYSDRLLERLAKRWMPEFRDHTTVDTNVTASVDSSPDVTKVDFSKMTKEQRDGLRALLQPTAVVAGEGETNE